ncbi:MAG: hypothetical protein ACK5KO_06485 [Arachnia sp.]
MSLIATLSDSPALCRRTRTMADRADSILVQPVLHRTSPVFRDFALARRVGNLPAGILVAIWPLEGIAEVNVGA